MATLKVGMIVFSRGLISPQLYRIQEIVDGRIADLKPLSLGAVPQQSPLNDLRRYRLRSTDEVSWKERMVRIRTIVNPRSADHYQYEIEFEGSRREMAPEYELEIHEGSLAADPASMLVQLDLAPWNLVSARNQLLDSFFKAAAKSLGIVGYNGARMLPIPHQINAARYALDFGRVRFLLADEVGLGKTIEAGLIASTLKKYFPSWSINAFVPESLTAQWAFEMYGKFGKMVFSLDLNEYDPEADAGTILPTYQAPEFAKRFAPDILIVDEAHRTLRDEKVVKALRELSKKAKAVLLLTATPVSDDSGNLLKLLQLVDPTVFDALPNPQYLRDLQSKQGVIEETLKAIRAKDIDAQQVTDTWKKVSIHDEEIEGYLERARKGTATRHQLHKVAALIVDRYYPGARILRYRRKFLSQENAMPFRIFDTIEYKVTSEEQTVLDLAMEWMGLVKKAGLSKDWQAQRLVSSMIQSSHSSPVAFADWIAMRMGKLERRDGVTADPIRLSIRAGDELPPFDGEADLLATMKKANDTWARATKAIEVTSRPMARSPRFMAFMDFIKETLEEEPDSHILVFTSFEANVHPMFLIARKALQSVAEVLEMSGPMDKVDREKAAFEFQETQGGCVLISDELGGEGRNFQFATHIIHFDLPLAPWIVEQRIGRCDRVGRDEEMDVDSQVIVAKGKLDEAFCDFLADGVGVFNDSIAPVEGDLDDIMTDVLSRCIDGGATGVLEQIDKVAEQLEEARERENAELLVRSAVGVEEARRVAIRLKDDDELENLRDDSIRYARLFESMVDEQDGERIAITVGEFHSLHATSGIRPEMIGYFERKEAVRHERLDFFSVGHPFIRTLTQLTMTESPDRAAIIERRGLDKAVLVCRFRVSLPPEFIQRVRELPYDLQPPLLSKSAELFGTQMLNVVVTMDGEILSDDQSEVYREPYTKGDVSHDQGSIVVPGITSDWSERIPHLASIAQEHADQVTDRLYMAKRGELEDVLVEAMTRVNESHDAAESEIEELMELLAVLTVDLDSIVYMVPFGTKKMEVKAISAPAGEESAASTDDDEDDDLMDMLLDGIGDDDEDEDL